MVLLIAHGAFEHSGRYGVLAAELAALGVASYAVDHHGHGLSPGRRGDLGSLETARDALAAVTIIARTAHRDPPWFLLGYSTGAVIALELALNGPPPAPAGLILIAPAVDAAAVRPWQAAVARRAARVLPRVGLVGVDPSALSRDAAALRDYTADPLVHDRRMSLRSVAQVIDATRSLPERLPALSVPLLTLHGEADTLAAPSGSALLHRHAASGDRTAISYPGARHDLLHDREAAIARADIAAWLRARI